MKAQNFICLRVHLKRYFLSLPLRRREPTFQFLPVSLIKHLFLWVLASTVYTNLKRQMPISLAQMWLQASLLLNIRLCGNLSVCSHLRDKQMSFPNAQVTVIHICALCDNHKQLQQSDHYKRVGWINRKCWDSTSLGKTKTRYDSFWVFSVRRQIIHHQYTTSVWIKEK